MRPRPYSAVAPEKIFVVHFSWSESGCPLSCSDLARRAISFTRFILGVMLTVHAWRTGEVKTAVDLSAATLPADIVWIDLLNGTAAEIEFVERTTGLRVPKYEELVEIESSSRLRTQNNALYLSAPIMFRAEAAPPQITPVGFVLTPDRLVTIRFEELTVFDTLKERVAEIAEVHPSSSGAFVALLEAMVDRMADALERVGSELKTLSHRVFHAETSETATPRRPAREDASLREILRRVGRGGDLASDIRDSLLGIGRMVPYVTSLGSDWLPADVKPRLETVRQDILSLTEYDAHLANKVQLLLDATFGLISIEQNNIIKVLTIVSVVGVPPTLVASMYGMNFKHMPELEWAWGYPYALALIVISAVAPLLWFKLRGWL
jgi:magnesium transporter